MEANNILKKPIAETGISDEFRKMCDLNGFKTLEDIVIFRAAQLTKKPGFSMHVFKELIVVLKKNGLESRLKD